MTDLHLLDLSENQFTGMIPLGIVNLRNLQSIDISTNHLEGELPAFTALTIINARISHLV
jgi:Leucine-rich repeat (LRR) protein